MDYAALVSIALRALLHNKIRSLLAVLGITIGIAVICVVAIGNAGQRRVEQQLNNLGDNFVWIEATSRAVNGVRSIGRSVLRFGRSQDGQSWPNKGWNVILRLFGPLQPFFDKTWRPGEIEEWK